MTFTLARCALEYSSTSSTKDYVDKLFNFFQNSSIFEIKNNSSAGRLVLNHIIEGWDLLFLASNDEIYLDLAIDPAGNITFNGSGEPTGSPQWSGVVRSFDNLSLGTAMHIIEYPDAILLGIKHSSGNYWRQCYHAGKIYSPFITSADTYVDGFGIMTGRGQISEVGLMVPSTQNASGLGATRVAQNVWSRDVIRTDTNFDPTANLISNVIRFIPYIYAIGNSSDPTNTTSLGFTKYLRRYKVASSHLTMIESSGTADQAFLIFAGDNLNSPLCCLWAKSAKP